METERVGIVARGFFRHYEINLNEGELHIDLPFAIDGIRLMENAHTPQVIEGIILSEFGIKVSVFIHHNLKLQTGSESYSMARRLEALDQQIARAETEYDRLTFSAPDHGRKVNPPALSRRRSRPSWHTSG